MANLHERPDRDDLRADMIALLEEGRHPMVLYKEGGAVNPDCRNGKHAACAGDAWDEERDEPTMCSCTCHGAT